MSHPNEVQAFARKIAHGKRQKEYLTSSFVSGTSQRANQISELTLTDQQPSEYQKWVHEQKKHDAEYAHSRDDEAWHKANEATVNSGNLALRTVVLINGGAAVTVLTFIGGLVRDGKLPIGAPLAQITSPLLWFAIGVAIATVAMGFGYLANYSNAGVLSSRDRNFEAPHIVETTVTKRWRWSATVFTVLSILWAIASLSCFIWGMLSVRDAISHLV